MGIGASTKATQNHFIKNMFSQASNLSYISIVLCSVSLMLEVSPAYTLDGDLPITDTDIPTVISCS